MLSNHLILCFPLLLLPSVFPTIKFFQLLLLYNYHNKLEKAIRIEKLRSLENMCYILTVITVKDRKFLKGKHQTIKSDFTSLW